MRYLYEKSGMEGISMHGNCGGWRTKKFFCLTFVYNWMLVSVTTNVYDVDCNKSLDSNLSQQYTDIEIYPRILILFSVVC